MRLRLRTLMTAVAVVGSVLGMVVHIQVLVHDEDDFALPILVLEVFAVSVLLAIAFVVGFVIRLIRKDDAYAAQLRRNDIPARCPVILAEADSPDQG
jgi:hypothetical protein